MQIDPEIKELLVKYFTFSRREYKATLAMLLLTAFIWLFGDLKNHFFPRTFDTAAILQKATELSGLQYANEMDSSHWRKSMGMKNSENENDNELSPVYFKFNPNSTSIEDFRKLGLSTKQIHIINNYISKVGEIKTKTDFRKIYGIPESQYEALEPYLDLPEKYPGKSKENYTKTSKNVTPLIVEINSADSLDLDKLPGIGMGYARRIIKYRLALGGFEKISQLLEVYGFRQTLLDSISPFLNVDPSRIVRININVAGVEELRKHPYFRYKIANALVSYRQQHGNFAAIEDLKNIVLITDEIYSKIKSYIRVD